MAIEQPSAPARRRGPEYPAAALAVILVIVVGTLLGGVVLPQYLNMRPVISAQQVSPASPAAPPAAPA
ncbi:MAG TPA: hypothetical protein VK881_01740, partial [bacterium]|nr:hypothetical protein [bacterium]